MRPSLSLGGRVVQIRYSNGPMERGGCLPGGQRLGGAGQPWHATETLRPGARADLAVLNVGLDTLLAADERLAGVRADLVVVDGREVPVG